MKTNGISRRKILRRARFATGSLNEWIETAGFGTDSRSAGGSTGVLWVTKGFFSSRFDKRDRISRPTPASVRRKGQAKIPSWEGKEGFSLQGWVLPARNHPPLHPCRGGESFSSFAV